MAHGAQKNTLFTFGTGDKDQMSFFIIPQEGSRNAQREKLSQAGLTTASADPTHRSSETRTGPTLSQHGQTSVPLQQDEPRHEGA